MLLSSKLDRDTMSVEKQANKFWNSNTNRIKELSHWIGYGRCNKSFWASTAQQHQNIFDFAMLLAGASEQKMMTSMVEWGCGSGINVLQLGKRFKTVHGVDISQANLNECKKNWDVSYSTASNTFNPILIDISNPEAVLQDLKSIDVFWSTACYQHFPSPAYGLRINQIAYNLLKPSGLAIIQIRYPRHSAKLVANTGNNYDTTVLTRTCYKLNQFRNHLSNQGFTILSHVVKYQPGYVFFIAQKL